MALEQETVLITGASSGFGEGTARALLDRGYTVYAAARRVERMQDLAAAGAHVLHMDVTDEASVQAGVTQMLEEQGHIDHVLANAGYGSFGMVECVPLEEIRRQYEVNVFGVARLLQAVLPHMRERRQGRIVLTASVVSHISTAAMGWYASTKHALAAVATSLRQEVTHLGIHVAVIEPGVVKTEFDEVAVGALDSLQPPEEYAEIALGYRRHIVASYANCPGPESTVAAMVHAVTATQPQWVYRTTTDARVLPWLRTVLGERIFSRAFLYLVRRRARSG